MKQEKSGNFFQNLLSSLFGGNDGEAEKRRQLRSISKRLSKSKFGKFYKFAGNEALPLLARNIFEIYKIIYPAQTMFQNLQNPNVLKRLAIDFYTPNEIRTLETSLSQENLLAMSKKIPAEKLKQQALTRLSEYSDYFTLEKITKIDTLYKQISCFRDLCMFDFYFFLKKFNKSLREADFSIIPQFEKINAEYLVEDLKDFMCVVKPVVEYSDWSDMMKMFKTTRGSEPINPAVWNKIVAKLKSIVSSLTFDYMLKLMSKDPDYFTDYEIKDEPIVDAYLDKIRQEAESTLAQLAAAQKSSQIDNYLNQIFGTTDVVRLRNYTEQASAPFERKSLGKYLYAGPINYYKAFLLDYIKKDLREFADLVLIRGTWSSQTLSTPMSNAYNALLESTEIINKFDDKMAEDGEIGIKLKTHMPRAERDRDARGIIATLLNDCNEEAKNICLDATRNLVTIAKVLKPLIEDYAKPKGVLIINWKELDKFSDHPIKQLGTDVYKHIYLFVTLMQNCFTQK